MARPRVDGAGPARERPALSSWSPVQMRPVLLVVLASLALAAADVAAAATIEVKDAWIRTPPPVIDIWCRPTLAAAPE
jgi:hypothetical protein